MSQHDSARSGGPVTTSGTTDPGQLAYPPKQTITMLYSTSAKGRRAGEKGWPHKSMRVRTEVKAECHSACWDSVSIPTNYLGVWGALPRNNLHYVRHNLSLLTAMDSNYLHVNPLPRNPRWSQTTASNAKRNGCPSIIVLSIIPIFVKLWRCLRCGP